MAFLLRPKESVAHGLRRLATRGLRSAQHVLRRTDPPSDRSIHEARKSVKKVRAIIELIEADGWRGLADCQKRLRKVNHTLSELRDAVAMLETLTSLSKRNPQQFDGRTFSRVRRHLSSHKHSLMIAAQQDRTWKTIDRHLRKLRQGAERWRPGHRQFGALAAGIQVAHRLGRKAMARAKKRQGPADFHEWRKQIKILWYQLRLVAARSPVIRQDVQRLHHAQAWLGDDHNVAVLWTELSKDASLCDLGRLRHAADRYQSALRRKSLASTTRIYADAPSKYVGRVKHAWHASRRRSKKRRSRRPRRPVA